MYYGKLLRSEKVTLPAVQLSFAFSEQFCDAKALLISSRYCKRAFKIRGGS